MEIQRRSVKTLGRAAFAWLLLAFMLTSMMLFLPAGTVRYWEAWAYLAILFIPATGMVAYLLHARPELLERRLRMREKEPRQQCIVAAAWVWFVLTYLVPGFDQRFGWSDVPAPVVAAADLVALLGYGVIFWVFRVNPYASRIVEVQPGQKVVATGPYAVVRHPMYVGGFLVYLATPLALGSYWAALPAALIVPILIARIRNEEQVLARDLEGYREYLQNTRYRLLPGIW